MAYLAFVKPASRLGDRSPIMRCRAVRLARGQVRTRPELETDLCSPRTRAAPANIRRTVPSMSEPPNGHSPICHRAVRCRKPCRCFDGRLLTRSRSEEHTSELQSRVDLVCRLLLEKKKKKI